MPIYRAKFKRGEVETNIHILAVDLKDAHDKIQNTSTSIEMIKEENNPNAVFGFVHIVLPQRNIIGPRVILDFSSGKIVTANPYPAVTMISVNQINDIVRLYDARPNMISQKYNFDDHDRNVNTVLRHPIMSGGVGLTTPEDFVQYEMGQ